jgi:hypothetical protein
MPEKVSPFAFHNEGGAGNLPANRFGRRLRFEAAGRRAEPLMPAR